MASLPLGLAGTQIFGQGTIGAAALGLVGSLFDSQILIPSLFGEDVGPPQIGSGGVNYAEDGTPVTYCVSRHNRIPGQIIYASEPYSRTTTTGGGKRQEVASITWYRDVLVAFCWNKTETPGGIRELRMNGQPVYRDPDSFPALNYTAIISGLGTQFVEVGFDPASGILGVIQEWTPRYSEGLGYYVWFLDRWHMAIQNVRGAGATYEPELAQFVPGENVTVSWSNESGVQTQFVFEVVESTIDGTNPTTGQPDTRLVIDLTAYILAFGSGAWSTIAEPTYTTEGEPPPESRTPWVPNQFYPFQPWPPSPGALWFFTFNQDVTGWAPDVLLDEPEAEIFTGPFNTPQVSDVLTHHKGLSLSSGVLMILLANCCSARRSPS